MLCYAVSLTFDPLTLKSSW